MRYIQNGYLIWEPPLDPPDEKDIKSLQELNILDLDLEEATKWYENYA